MCVCMAIVECFFSFLSFCTRMLSDLSRQVESSTREVSQLQAKLESTHSKEMQEQVHRAKTHEEQLKSKSQRIVYYLTSKNTSG